jgi:hypothetical protein
LIRVKKTKAINKKVAPVFAFLFGAAKPAYQVAFA